MKLRLGSLALLVFWSGAPPLAGQEAVLHGIIRDASTGSLSPCTVAIQDAKGKIVVENDSFHSGFRCCGEFTKRLPAGRTRLRVTRGFETQSIEKELDLKPGTTTEVEFMLRRSVDLRKRGWFAGDSHVHMLHGERAVPVSFDLIALTARAEDLQYLSLAQAWDLPNPTPEALQTELDARSTPDCVLTWNLEAPKNYYKGDAGRCLGHCWTLGMRRRSREGADVIKTLLEASAWDYESDKPTYANFESHRLIHEQGGAVFYTHPARWWMGPWGGKGGYPKMEQMRVSNMAVELPLDTVIGPTFDGLDVITGPGELEANQKAFELWALLLNHGYRVAATGSSDACFDRPGGGVPGVPRTYTFLLGRFSLSKVTRATSAGHSFVTTGPLLIATLDNKPPGSSFHSGNKPHQLAIEGWASGDGLGGLDRLEVLRNGSVDKTLPLAGQLAFRTNMSLVEPETGWYCVRLWAGGSKKRYAVTSAFYIGNRGYHPPQAVSARIHATIIDAETGAPLSGSLTEVAYRGTLSHNLKRHGFNSGQKMVIIPATERLRAESPGYEPEVLSPVLDNGNMMAQITQLRDTDILDWTTFERIRQQFDGVELLFKLHSSTP